MRMVANGQVLLSHATGGSPAYNRMITRELHRQCGVLKAVNSAQEQTCNCRIRKIIPSKRGTPVALASR